MPTPSDDAALSSSVPDATPAEGATIYSIFTSCPPEETREQLLASQDAAIERDDIRRASAEHILHYREGDDAGALHRTAQRDNIPLAPDSTPSQTAQTEPKQTEHATARSTESPSPPNSDSLSDSDARLAHRMSSATITSELPPPQYLHFPETDHARVPHDSITSFLRPGSKFRGTQQSDRQVYDVQVEIKDVDLSESFLCGYLRIQGLTDDHPTLTTFFEGEIIGPKYLFKTTHATWGSNEKVDLQHWARFPAWRPLAKSAKSPNFTLKNFLQREHVFMRWKEYFLVPDHRVKTITGASFEGFYYICFNQCSGNVSGIYFHAKSEKYQQLELRHVEDHGCMAAMEFR